MVRECWGEREGGYGGHGDGPGVYVGTSTKFPENKDYEDLRAQLRHYRHIPCFVLH